MKSKGFPDGADLTEDMHSVGVQVISNGNNLCVSSVLPGFSPSAIGINDKLQLPNIDLNSPEAVNCVCEALSSKGHEKDINISVNGRNITVSAPSEAWCFLQGESPCRVRFSQPPVLSVA